MGESETEHHFTTGEIMVIFIILILMFINTASLNMMIPSYATIIADFGIPDAWIYIPDSLMVLVSAFFSVLWGYYTDRLDRSKIIMGGAFLTAIGLTYSAFCNDFMNLLVARIVTGAGMGCILPVGISILGDIVPPEERSGWFGFLAIFSSISNATGNAMSAFLAPLNILKWQRGWQFPFIILSFLALIPIFMLIFIRLPDLGSKEESLAELAQVEDLEYGYQINQKELVKMLKKPTNRYLIINGFFSIIPGTVLIFMLITTLSHPERGMFAVLPEEIRTQVSTIMAGLVGIGYLVGNIVLSWVGDLVYQKDKRYRALLAFITQALAIPFLLIMIYELSPINLADMPTYPTEIPADEVTDYVLQTLKAIFNHYPNYILFFIFSFLGSFLGAGFVPNKNAIMIDVNLPEHRGTATSFFQLTELIGKSLTLMIISGLLTLFNNNYKAVLYMGIMFWVPSALLWFATSKKIQKDLDEKDMILRERTQLTFIDYFFELQIAMDDGIQLVQDAKKKMLKDVNAATKILDRAINKFKWIVLKARKENVLDIEAKARELMDNALMFKNDLLMLPKKPNQKQLKELYEKIDSIWDASDFGKIEILYEDAYLKVCEARLRRNYNPKESSQILQSAIDIYDRVIRLASDRVIEEGVKKLTEDEEAFQERIHQLLVLAQKSKSNTELLKNKLDAIIKKILDKNITPEELDSLIVLTSEYGLKLHEIVQESFEGRMGREVKKLMSEIDQLFKEYDEWQMNE